MAEYLIQDTTLSAIGDAIRNKTGNTEAITPENMPTEIEGIKSGSDIITEPLTVEENGTYSAESGKAYTPVTVSVPQTTIEPLSVTENGTYTAESGKAFNPVVVDVQGGKTGRIIYSDYDDEGYPHTLEYVPASSSDTKLSDRFISYGHPYTMIGWHSRIENIICPDYITELGIGGFSISKSVKSISNYDSLRIVGNNCFSGERISLDVDHLPPNLEYIGDNGFERSPNNYKITNIPNSVYYIGQSAFQYTNANYLQLSKLPTSLQYLGKNAFYNNGFQIFPEDEIVFPNGVVTIGYNCFGGGAYKTKTIKFLGKPETIDVSAFLLGTTNGSMKALTDIYCPWSEGEVANAPWGATNATIHYDWVEEGGIT